jgi:hypothetical protein
MRRLATERLGEAVACREADVVGREECLEREGPEWIVTCEREGPVQGRGKGR